MRVLVRILWFLVYYFLSWSIAYAFVMFDDWSYFIDYLFLAWTLRGFEAPMTIWVLSVLVFLGLLLVVDPLCRKSFGRGNQSNMSIGGKDLP